MGLTIEGQSLPWSANNSISFIKSKPQDLQLISTENKNQIEICNKMEYKWKKPYHIPTIRYFDEVNRTDFTEFGTSYSHILVMYFTMVLISRHVNKLRNHLLLIKKDQ